MTQYGVYNPLCPSVTVIRMRKMGPIIDRSEEAKNRTNFDNIANLAVVGTNTGVIHLVDAFTAKIERDFQVATPLRLNLTFVHLLGPFVFRQMFGMERSELLYFRRLFGLAECFVDRRAE